MLPSKIISYLLTWLTTTPEDRARKAAQKRLANWAKVQRSKAA